MTRSIEPAASRGPAKRLRRLGGLRVSEALYKRVHGRVMDVLPILEPGEVYDAADLCGSNFMARLRPGRQRQVEACLADMAARGALPLTPVRRDPDRPPRYRLT